MFLHVVFQVIKIRQVQLDLADQRLLEESLLVQFDHDFGLFQLSHALLEKLNEDMGAEVAHSCCCHVLDNF